MPKKKKTIEKNHSSNKIYMPRVRRELVDVDYLKDLPEKERKYMEKFLGEYYGGNLNTENPRKNIHKSREKIKDCFDRNNRQNNDLFGVTKANGLLDNEVVYQNNEEKEYVHPANQSANTTEEAMIEYVDNKELMEYDEKELDIIYNNYNFEIEDNPEDSKD